MRSRKRPECQPARGAHSTVTLPLAIDVPGEDGEIERVSLYPELEEEVAAAASGDAGGGWADRVRGTKRAQMRGVPHVDDAPRDLRQGGLPKDMTFTRFRHGGLTEIGDAGEADPRAVSGHKTLAAARHEHIAALGALDEAVTEGKERAD